MKQLSKQEALLLVIGLIMFFSLLSSLEKTGREEEMEKFPVIQNWESTK